jgi:predicted RNA-binding Zn-ribbon protein involved in translation (DUF1610 family)
MAQFQCATCKNVMVSRVPAFRVFNFPESSGVIMAHERMAKCPNCGTVYIPLIGNVGKQGEIELVWKPISTGESAIKTPTMHETELINKSKKM